MRGGLQRPIDEVSPWTVRDRARVGCWTWLVFIEGHASHLAEIHRIESQVLRWSRTFGARRFARVTAGDRSVTSVIEPVGDAVD